jgi:predicted site-specific integrase-resolvase
MNHRCALYARVSTNNGHQDPAMQLAELREYCRRGVGRSSGNMWIMLPARKSHAQNSNG